MGKDGDGQALLAGARWAEAGWPGQARHRGNNFL